MRTELSLAATAPADVVTTAIHAAHPHLSAGSPEFKVRDVRSGIFGIARLIVDETRMTYVVYSRT